jgi:hypothetical protein
LLVDDPAALHHNVAVDAGACVTNADIAAPPGSDDPMATLNRAISAHLSELDRQQHVIGDKYDAFRALLVTAQATFTLWQSSSGYAPPLVRIPPPSQH